MTEEKPKMSMSFEVRARRIDAHGGAWYYVDWNTSPQGSPAARAHTINITMSRIIIPSCFATFVMTAHTN